MADGTSEMAQKSGANAEDGVCASETPTTDQLAVVAHMLDQLAANVAAFHNPAASIADQLKAAMDASEAEPKSDLQKYEINVEARQADARLEIARILARHAIEDQKRQCAALIGGGDGGCTGSQTICPAFDPFIRANKLDDSARDIVAAATLMPKAAFRAKAEELGNDTRKMALHFRVPVGAVALRRRILQHAP